jgi:YggT family protein
VRGAARGYIRRVPLEFAMLALIQTVLLALDIYWWIIILSAVFSWLYAFNVVNSRNEVVGMIGNFLFRATEPALRPIRRVLPDLGGLDISPIILLLLLFFVRQLIVTTIAPALLA